MLKQFLTPKMVVVVSVAAIASGALLAGDPLWTDITDADRMADMVRPEDYLAQGSLDAAVWERTAPRTIPEQVARVSVRTFNNDPVRHWAKLYDADGHLLAYAGSRDGQSWHSPIVAGPFIDPPELDDQGHLCFSPQLRRCIAPAVREGQIQAPDIPQDTFSFAIFTDTHIKPPSWNTMHTGLLLQAIGSVLTTTPRPDFLIVTGDLDGGTGDARYGGQYVHAGSFQNWLEHVSLAQVPVYPTLGNHDPRYAFRYLVLGQDEASTEPVNYAFNAGRWRMIVLDHQHLDVDTDEHPPHFQKTANWLQEQLDQYSDHPVMIFAHAPLVRITCGDYYSPEIADRFLRSPADRNIILDILAAHANVKCVFNGHIHCADHAVYRGIHFVSGAATMGNNYNGRFWSRTEWWDNGYTGVRVDGLEFHVFTQLMGETPVDVF